MNLLLVDNLVMPEDGSRALLDVHPNLGLLALAAAAETAHHTTEIYDPKRLLKSGQLQYDSTLYERVAAELLAKRPSAVGFTTLGCSFLFAVNVAAILKRGEPDMPILLGGPHATMLDRPILERFEQFDVIVRHEADETFPFVLEELEFRSFEDIPGISWRAFSGPSGLRFTEGRPKVEDLDSLPIVSYEPYPVEDLDLNLLRIEAGRGCPFMCTFCSTASFFQRSFRLKSAERLVRELDILHARYGFTEFKLDHDMFTVNRRKVVEFCEAVKGRGYRWRASARLDCVDKELLEKMAESGCASLYFGIETGSVRLQEICKKHLDLNLVRPMLDVAHAVGIETTASLITGYPEEEERDQDDTLDMLGDCFRPACLPQLHMLAPEPGTAMYTQLSDKIEYDGYGGRYNALLVNSDDEQLILDHPEIFQTYYYYPAAMPRWRYIFAVEAVDVFRKAGPVVLKYLLRAYEGRLSRLVAEFRQFAEANGLGNRPDCAMAEEFLRSKFGRTHHLVSLYGFAVRTSDGEEADFPASASYPLDPALPYKLNRGTYILHDCHDCGVLLDRIKRQSDRTDLFDDSEAGERGTYLLKVSGKESSYTLIDPGVEAILSLFEQPRRYTEVADLVAEATGMPKLGTSFFRDLAQTEIIVPAAA
jgi:radical SAM superfamily enzyme YgiQ (UPF0313 family)